jgi:hypothetical protein
MHFRSKMVLCSSHDGANFKMNIKIADALLHQMNKRENSKKRSALLIWLIF